MSLRRHAAGRSPRGSAAEGTQTRRRSARPAARGRAHHLAAVLGGDCNVRAPGKRARCTGRQALCVPPATGGPALRARAAGAGRGAAGDGGSAAWALCRPAGEWVQTCAVMAAQAASCCSTPRSHSQVPAAPERYRSPLPPSFPLATAIPGPPALVPILGLTPWRTPHPHGNCHTPRAAPPIPPWGAAWRQRPRGTARPQQAPGLGRGRWQAPPGADAGGHEASTRSCSPSGGQRKVGRGGRHQGVADKGTAV